jgi:tRNA pseudouridine55 synthase
MPQGIHGVVLLDKPEGISSQTAVTIVKRAFDADKAGHTGTLDPMATGLLPVCLGEATKYSQDLLDADKTYLATIKFGEKTSTGDAEGEVIEVKEANFDVTDAYLLQEKLAEVAEKFTGEIAQIPPMYSALKRDGKPLYEYARAGETLEREARKVTIHSLKWVDISWPVAQLEVSCSKGTYVRTLAEDIGDYLGSGAHLIGLRREKVGHLSLGHGVTLETVKNNHQDKNIKPEYLLPVDALVQDLNSLGLTNEEADRLRLGQRVPVSKAGSNEELMRIYRGTIESCNFMGTADWRKGVLHPRRLIAQAAAVTNLTN